MHPPARFKPTRADLDAAKDKVLRDVIAQDLRILFCGINPSLYTAAVGHHFARPGNRFWPALFDAGLTPRRYMPWEDRQLLELGLGVTNLVRRATAQAAELSMEEVLAGAAALRRKVMRYRPRVLALLGVSVYRIGFAAPKAVIGLQPQGIGSTLVYVLPNPSGLNAHFQAPQLAKLFGELRPLMMP